MHKTCVQKPLSDGAVCVGRNVGHQAMATDRWFAFVVEIAAAVQLRGGQIHTTAYGQGEWDGTPEDTAVVLFTGVDAEALATDLALLAVIFEQDAIALIAGVSTLVLSAGANCADRRSAESL